MRKDRGWHGPSAPVLGVMDNGAGPDSRGLRCGRRAEPDHRGGLRRVVVQLAVGPGFFSFLSTAEQVISPGLPSPVARPGCHWPLAELELIRAAVLVEVEPDHACRRQPVCQRGACSVRPPAACCPAGWSRGRVAEGDAAARPRPPGTFDVGAGPPPQQPRLLDAPAEDGALTGRDTAAARITLSPRRHG